MLILYVHIKENMPSPLLTTGAVAGATGAGAIIMAPTFGHFATAGNIAAGAVFAFASAFSSLPMERQRQIEAGVTGRRATVIAFTRSIGNVFQTVPRPLRPITLLEDAEPESPSSPSPRGFSRPNQHAFVHAYPKSQERNSGPRFSDPGGVYHTVSRTRTDEEILALDSHPLNFDAPTDTSVLINGNRDQVDGGSIEIQAADNQDTNAASVIYRPSGDTNLRITPGGHDIRCSVVPPLEFPLQVNGQTVPGEYHTDDMDSINNSIHAYNARRDGLVRSRVQDIEGSLTHRSERIEESPERNPPQNQNQHTQKNRRGSLVKITKANGEKYTDNSKLVNLTKQEFDDHIYNAKMTGRVQCFSAALASPVIGYTAVNKLSSNASQAPKTNPEPEQLNFMDSDTFSNSHYNPSEDPNPISGGSIGTSSKWVDLDDNSTSPFSLPTPLVKYELIRWNIPWIILGLLILREAYKKYTKGRPTKRFKGVLPPSI